MARMIVNLTVVLDFDEDDVRNAEDFGGGGTPEQYLRAALPSFLDNEINNCAEFPAQSASKITDDWGWLGAPEEAVTQSQEAPDGLAVFAHWSASHEGVNVEIDAPEDLPLTVHVNDWRAVNVVVGTTMLADSDVTTTY